MVLLGSLDDRLDLSGKVKFLIQLVVGFLISILPVIT